MQGSTTHNLKLDGLAIELDRADLEIDTDRRDVALCVPVSPRERERERESNMMTSANFHQCDAKRNTATKNDGSADMKRIVCVHMRAKAIRMVIGQQY